MKAPTDTHLVFQCKSINAGPDWKDTPFTFAKES